MKILVIGGMHGNEPLGPKVVDLFRQEPQSNVRTVLANEIALKQNVRFIENDLNRSFPGDSSSESYEQKRPVELLKLCRKFDIVLDFHNTHCPDNDCGFVGEKANPKLLGLTESIGLDRVVIADYDCINKYAPNCLSVEISLGSEAFDPKIWYERIKRLSKLSLEMTYGEKVRKYRFVYRMTLEDRDKLGLANQNLKAFKPIDSSLALKLGVKQPAYPIFVGDGYTPYNYGGILTDY